jgi:uncharacterized membrane protein
MQSALPPPKSQRWLDIDALRGLAVLLMITQHVAYWLVSSGHRNHWVVLFTGALGGMAAPIFVLLAGVGVVLTAQRHDASDRLLVLRGATIIGFGYLMNFLTPHWFSMGSWYVLHLIGIALISAPLLRRVSTPWLLALLAVVLVATILIQNHLDTPFRLFNDDMAAPKKPGGVLRFAVAEGFFPIFPWLAFFMAGIAAGRWKLVGQTQYIWRLAAVMIALLAVLTGLFAAGVDVARDSKWIRFFLFKSTFYPALTPITLLLISVALLFVYVFGRIERRFSFGSSHALVCLGRASLTFLILHVAIIRESAYYFGFWKSLPALATLIIVALLLIGFSLAAIAWRKIQFKYGAEWLLRKIAGQVNSL